MLSGILLNVAFLALNLYLKEEALHNSSKAEFYIAGSPQYEDIGYCYLPLCKRGFCINWGIQ